MNVRLLVIGALFAASASIVSPAKADDNSVAKLQEIANTQQEIVTGLQESFKARKYWNEKNAEIVVEFAERLTALDKTVTNVKLATDLREVLQLAAGYSKQGRFNLPSLKAKLIQVRDSKEGKKYAEITALLNGLLNDIGGQDENAKLKDAEGLDMPRFGQGPRSNINHDKEIKSMLDTKQAAVETADVAKETPSCSDITNETDLLNKKKAQSFMEYKAAQLRDFVEGKIADSKKARMAKLAEKARHDANMGSYKRLTKGGLDEFGRLNAELAPLKDKSQKLADKKASIQKGLVENLKKVEALSSHFTVMPTVEAIFASAPFAKSDEEAKSAHESIKQALVSSVRQDSNEALENNDSDMNKVFMNLSLLKTTPGLSQLSVTAGEGFKRTDMNELKAANREYKKLAAELTLVKFESEDSQKLIELAQEQSMGRMTGLAKGSKAEMEVFAKIQGGLTGIVDRSFAAQASKRADRLAKAKHANDQLNDTVDHKLRAFKDGDVLKRCGDIATRTSELDVYGATPAKLKDVRRENHMIQMWTGPRSGLESKTHGKK